MDAQSTPKIDEKSRNIQDMWATAVGGGIGVSIFDAHEAPWQDFLRKFSSKDIPEKSEDLLNYIKKVHKAAKEIPDNLTYDFEKLGDSGRSAEAAIKELKGYDVDKLYELANDKLKSIASDIKNISSHANFKDLILNHDAVMGVRYANKFLLPALGAGIGMLIAKKAVLEPLHTAQDAAYTNAFMLKQTQVELSNVRNDFAEHIEKQRRDSAEQSRII